MTSLLFFTATACTYTKPCSWLKFCYVIKTSIYETILLVCINECNAHGLDILGTLSVIPRHIKTSNHIKLYDLELIFHERNSVPRMGAQNMHQGQKHNTLLPSHRQKSGWANLLQWTLTTTILWSLLDWQISLLCLMTFKKKERQRRYIPFSKLVGGC